MKDFKGGGGLINCDTTIIGWVGSRAGVKPVPGNSSKQKDCDHGMPEVDSSLDSNGTPRFAGEKNSKIVGIGVKSIDQW